MDLAPTRLPPRDLPLPVPPGRTEGTSPEPVEGTCPEPVEGTCPEPVEGTCPEPVEGTCPEPVEGTCPEPVEGTCPEPVEGTCPEPVEGTCPEPVEGACPRPVEGPRRWTFSNERATQLGATYQNEKMRITTDTKRVRQLRIDSHFLSGNGSSVAKLQGASGTKMGVK